MAGKLLVHLRQQWIGVIALLLVLTGGTAYALDGSNTVFSDDIVNGDVKTDDIGNAEVKVADVGQAAVATDEIANNQVKTGDIGDGEVRAADIANGQVMAAELADNSVRSDEVADGEVRSQEIGNGQVEAQDLAPGVAPGASGARAWGLVDENEDLVRSKQVTAVTNPVFGFYCIDPAPGIDVDTAVMLVSPDAATSATGELQDNVSQLEWSSDPLVCPATTMEVQGFLGDGEPPTLGNVDEGGFSVHEDNEAFAFVIP
jgi:hypothetical protein